MTFGQRDGLAIIADDAQIGSGSQLQQRCPRVHLALQRTSTLVDQRIPGCDHLHAGLTGELGDGLPQRTGSDIELALLRLHLPTQQYRYQCRPQTAQLE